jgi:DNA-binding protein YbaB
MKPIRHTLLAVALAAAFPALAQSNADILKELQQLRAKVNELEAKLKAQESKVPAGGAQWGMTPEQARELNRVSVKAEALEDAVEAQGLKMLKINGYADPTYIYNARQRRGGFQFINNVGDDGYNYDNSYFGAASIDFQKEMDGGTRWRLTLVPNRGN